MRDEIDAKSYPPFMINNGLSQFQDTVLFANEMNKYYCLDNKMQYDFLFYGVPKGKRRDKWAKADVSDDVNSIMEYYCVNRTRALEYLEFLTHDQVAEIKSKLNPGGASSPKKNK